MGKLYIPAKRMQGMGTLQSWFADIRNQFPFRHYQSYAYRLLSKYGEINTCHRLHVPERRVLHVTLVHTDAYLARNRRTMALAMR